MKKSTIKFIYFMKKEKNYSPFMKGILFYEKYSLLLKYFLSIENFYFYKKFSSIKTSLQ